MPCYDGGAYDDSAAQTKTIDMLTRLLCEAGKVHRKEKSPSKELVKWWKDHQLIDHEREG